MTAAVFDCVVYVQAALSRKGPAFACLSLAEAEHVTLYLSPEILDDEFRKAYPWLAIVNPPAFLSHVRAEVAKELGYE